MSSFLFTSDIHLSDRPKDRYRFDLFPWLCKQQEKYDVEATFILGDITENKDKHSSTLVNRIVDSLKQLRPPVFILRGNHDGNDPDCPFFKFLSNIEGLQFIIKPCFLAAHNVAMIPHCRTQAEFNEACKVIPKKCRAVCLHNTFEGAIAETGAPLSGLAASLATFRGARWVLAGDVHRPQSNGVITYLGAPFHVRFGDRFKPRVVLEHGTITNLEFPAPHKWSLKINDPDDLFNTEGLKKGDQVKVELALQREELVEWPEQRRRVLEACKKLELEVYGIDLKAPETKKRPDVQNINTRTQTSEQVFAAYCQQERLSSTHREAGAAILSETDGLDTRDKKDVP
jgi:predicted phosphodiesterase